MGISTLAYLFIYFDYRGLITAQSTLYYGIFLFFLYAQLSCYHHSLHHGFVKL